MTEFKPDLNRSLVKDSSNLILIVAGVIVIIVCYTLLPQLLIVALLLGSLLVAGFLLPRYVGSEVARKRAHQGKVNEFNKWGLVSRDHEGPWLNNVSYPVVKDYPPCQGLAFSSEWLLIKDGLIIVNPGASRVDRRGNIVEYDMTSRSTYSWDGCSPKRWFYWLAIVGTPDWHKKEMTIKTLSAVAHGKWMVSDKIVYWQLTDYASLVHDALYQYLDYIPLKKSQVDSLFHEMLKDANMIRWLSWMYYLAVKFFGGKFYRPNPWNNLYTIKGVDIVENIQSLDGIEADVRAS